MKIKCRDSSPQPGLLTEKKFTCNIFPNYKGEWGRGMFGIFLHLQNTLNSKTTKNFTNFMFHSEVMTQENIFWRWCTLCAVWSLRESHVITNTVTYIGEDKINPAITVKTICSHKCLKLYLTKAFIQYISSMIIIYILYYSKIPYFSRIKKVENPQLVLLLVWLPVPHEWWIQWSFNSKKLHCAKKKIVPV